jgi:DNA adenine methylase
MYSYARAFSYTLNYTAQQRYVGSEVMFFSDRLEAPGQATEMAAA